jgi:hypothetical protein
MGAYYFCVSLNYTSNIKTRMLCNLVEMSPWKVYKDVPYILASDMVHTMYTYYPEEFQKRILGGSPEKLVKFWNQVRVDDPRLIRHPLRERPDFVEKCFPVGTHSDGVPYKKSGIGQSLLVTTFFSLLAIGLSTWDTRWMQWALACDVVCTPEEHDGLDTLADIWTLAYWDFAQLLHGTYFENDAWGVPITEDQAFRFKKKGKLIAGGFLGALLQLRADLDWMVKVFLAVATVAIECEGIMS